MLEKEGWGQGVFVGLSGGVNYSTIIEVWGLDDFSHGIQVIRENLGCSSIDS